VTTSPARSELRRRLAQALLVTAVPVLAMGTSHSAWVDQVRIEAHVTFAPGAVEHRPTAPDRSSGTEDGGSDEREPTEGTDRVETDQTQPDQTGTDSTDETDTTVAPEPTPTVTPASDE